jgi:hypothetical protein
VAAFACAVKDVREPKHTNTKRVKIIGNERIAQHGLLLTSLYITFPPTLKILQLSTFTILLGILIFYIHKNLKKKIITHDTSLDIRISRIGLFSDFFGKSM